MQDLLTVEQRNTRRLAKIHKLKRENRTLSSRRKELIKATALDSKITDFNKPRQSLGESP